MYPKPRVPAGLKASAINIGEVNHKGVKFLLAEEIAKIWQEDTNNTNVHHLNIVTQVAGLVVHSWSTSSNCFENSKDVLHYYTKNNKQSRICLISSSAFAHINLKQYHWALPQMVLISACVCNPPASLPKDMVEDMNALLDFALSQLIGKNSHFPYRLYCKVSNFLIECLFLVAAFLPNCYLSRLAHPNLEITLPIIKFSCLSCLEQNRWFQLS